MTEFLRTPRRAVAFPAFLRAAVLAAATALVGSAHAGSATYSTAGTWTAPPGITSVTVEAWGGGGAGGGATANPSAGGGGAGGQYAAKVFTVTPGTTYPLAVGAGGTGGTGAGGSGGDSTFNNTWVVAKGGSGGAAGAPSGSGGSGSATGGVGSTVYAGGAGSAGSTSGGYGGAGGGAAGSSGAGGNASGATAGSGTANGGGNGAAGLTSRGSGGAGSVPGGGGGGGYATSKTDQSGGNGGNGQVVLTWIDIPPVATTGSATSVAATSATLNGTVVSNSAATLVYFQYGTDTNYGTTVAASQVSLTPATTSSPISLPLTGLSCSTTYHFRAYASSSGGDSYGNDATFTTPTCPVILSKTISSAAAAVGSYVTFNLTATNANGSTTLSNVVVTDVIPTGMSYSTNVATLGTVSVSGQTVTWTIASLPPGTSADLTLVVLLNTKGTFTNTVTSPGATSASATILVLPSAITHYRMDEAVGSWANGVANVIDSGGNALNGHLRQATTTTTNTVSPNPTIASQQSSVVGGFCNAGKFDGNAVVESPYSAFFQFKQTLSASAWVYPTAYPSSDLYSILSNDVNYEFHLDTGGHLYWWWQASTLTSATTIPLNKWTHVAITMDAAAGRERIYINGVLDSNTNNWKGTLATNSCPFYIGGDISTGSNCTLLTGRSFHGMIDEAKIYNYELSAAEVQADMTLGRLCSGTFDHIQIEHDGTASTCSPKTVTVKACLDAGCTALYPGSVTVQLSPTGWTPSDIITINGGVTLATLNNTSISAPSLTLGTVSVTPAPANPTRCFNDTAETCTLSVSAANSCAFDAVEVGAAAGTNIYTKLAGAQFSLDLLGPSTYTSLLAANNNSNTVSYDLVDASTVACSSASTSLTSPATYSYSSTAYNGGRGSISLTYPTAKPNVQVRIKVGSSYACSTDKFAIRPSAVKLTSTDANAYSATDLTLTSTAPNPTATKVVKAGAAFSLGATATPSSYSGVMALGPAPLAAQLPLVGSAPQSGGTVGTLTFDTLTVNSAAATAKYSEVGYLYANAGSVSDGGSFTSVDHNPTCAATNTCDCWMPTSDATYVDYLSDTLVNKKYGCYVGNKVAFVFGRFIPDHFSTVATGPMACPSGMTCASGGLVYSGQPLSPLTITAKAASESTTQNYASSFARNVTLGAWDGNGSTATNRTATPGVLAPLAVAAGDFAAGVATKTATTTPPTPATYTFGTVPTAPTDIYIRATENTGGDGVTSLRSPANTSIEGGVTVASGRLKISNATGSEKQSLQVPVEADLWSGLAWVQNSADSITSFTKNSVLLVQPATWTSPITATVQAVSAGKWNLVLSAPGKAGSVDLAIDLGSTATDNSCLATHGTTLTAVGAPWLRGTWCSAVGAGQADPSGRATFGIYTPENRRTIFIRELY